MSASGHAVLAYGAGGSSGEMRPRVVSTMQVFEDDASNNGNDNSQGNNNNQGGSGTPDYCTRGTRFGTHSCNEALASIPSTFFAPDFGKLTYIAYFDGGARVFDIRDPYITRRTSRTTSRRSRRCRTASSRPTSSTACSSMTYRTTTWRKTSNGLTYSVDRVSYGLDILQLMPPAALIRNSQ
jgi:hypothetical protein